MTIRTPSWLQAGSFPAENDRLLLKSLLGGSPNQASTSGVAGSTADLAVTASGTPDMNVHVAPGAAFVPGTETTTQGVYGVYIDASVTVPIAAADGTNPRISLIVLQVLDAGYSGSSNIGQAIEVAGTPASSPVAPAVPKNSIVLAQVLVAHSVTSITSGAITDERTYAELGGRLIRPACRVYQTAALTYSSGATHYLPFDTVQYDNFGGFTTGSSAHYTVPEAGVYAVSVLATFVTDTAADAYVSFIAKNGVQWSAGGGSSPAGTAGLNALAVDMAVKCNAGDTLAGWYFAATAVAAGTGATAGNFMSIAKVSD